MRCLGAILILLATASGAAAQGYVEETEEEIRAVPAPAAFRGTLPQRVDISATVPPPRDQGRAAICTSWAATYGAASWALRRQLADPGLRLSPTFTYNQVSRDPLCISVTSLPATLNLLKTEGALPLSDYAYDAGWCGRLPTQAEHARARRYRIAGWRVLPGSDLAAVKAQLAQGIPVLFGANVGPAMHALKADGVWTGERAGDPLAGHSMLLVGYDDGRKAFRIQNSWGSQWADGGYGWISYDFFQANVRHAFVIE